MCIKYTLEERRKMAYADFNGGHEQPPDYSNFEDMTDEEFDKAIKRRKKLAELKALEYPANNGDLILGIALIVIGLLFTPFLIGIPLLIWGIVKVVNHSK